MNGLEVYDFRFFFRLVILSAEKTPLRNFQLLTFWLLPQGWSFEKFNLACHGVSSYIPAAPGISSRRDPVQG
nr:Hypothetical protein [Pseudomonas aeruginosa]